MLAMLLGAMPQDVDKLLIFTQCFGGNIARTPSIATLPRTAIASGTSPGEVGFYGGYNDDAARALRPGTGRTGSTVHTAGTAGKYEKESPITAGTKTLGSFSLESTRTSATVTARVIVIYMGKPDTKREWLWTDQNGITHPAPESWVPGSPMPPGRTYQQTSINDASDRDAIIRNFANEPNTTIISVGDFPTANGRAKPGWNQPATRRGLYNAIVGASGILQHYAASDLQPQFILYVGDHGNLGRGKAANAGSRRNTRSVIDQSFGALPRDPSLREQLLREPNNQPAFSVFLTPFPSGTLLPSSQSALNLSNASFRLHLTSATAAHDLNTSEVVVFNPDDSAQLGDGPDEGIWIHFNVAEQMFLDDLTGVTLKLELTNDSDLDFTVTEIVQSTGAVSRGHRAPQVGSGGNLLPWLVFAFIGVVLIGVIVFLRLRRRQIP